MKRNNTAARRVKFKFFYSPVENVWAEYSPGDNIRAEYCPRENIQAVQTAVIDQIDMGDNVYFGLNIAHVRTPPPLPRGNGHY